MYLKKSLFLCIIFLILNNNIFLHLQEKNDITVIQVKTQTNDITNKVNNFYFKIPKTLFIFFTVFTLCLLISLIWLLNKYIKIKIIKEKVEISDKLKTMFLANMSHEIRTPLNGILGFSSILATEKLKESEKKEYKKIIDACSKQLLFLISDILDSAKIESKELKIYKEKFLLNDAMQEIYDLFKTDNGYDKDIKLIYTPKKSKYYIFSDENRFKQILNNLLSNAFKFTQNGIIEFTYSKEKNNYHFSVKDTGLGINKSDYELIFERFGRVDKAQSKKYKGTGLGLSITKELINILGGKIWFKSELKIGSTFHFTLPVE